MVGLNAANCDASDATHKAFFNAVLIFSSIGIYYDLATVDGRFTDLHISQPPDFSGRKIAHNFLTYMQEYAVFNGNFKTVACLHLNCATAR